MPAAALPENSVHALRRKLLVCDVNLQLPGTAIESVSELTVDEARKLVSHASVLAFGSQADKADAYDIATRLIEIFGEKLPGIVNAADVILSRLGNFPGRQLLRNRYTSSANANPMIPTRLRLEGLAREFENSVVGPANEHITLTDFQFELFQQLDGHPSVSVSAPTSAGKSFVMGLDLVRRLHKMKPSCVVYVVPTRALIREVSLKTRHQLRRAGMEDVPVRTVPFPIEIAQAPNGAVFVLTQERLLSLLHSTQGVAWISTLVIDEAQSIRDGARGILLQSVIETVIERFPDADIHFASPLASNPGYLLSIFNRKGRGSEVIETISPVSQNVILVSPVQGKPTQARFELLTQAGRLPLGTRKMEFKFRDPAGQRRAALARAVTRDDESTLIFANDPSGAEETALALVEGLPVPANVDPELTELVEFIRLEVHADYGLVTTLPHGVAFHYGDMPSIVRSRVEDLFKAEKIRLVCCTSTLLQGVNLPARHILIENPKRGSGNPMQRRDFLNLAGRAGRLQHEFHGNVWCVNPADWEEKSFEGESLQEIRSALSVVMIDGGTVVNRLLDGKAEGKESDLAEATLCKIYSGFVRTNRDLVSEFRTDLNLEVLSATAKRCAELAITLPTEILAANCTVRPDRLQALYNFLNQQQQLDTFLPIHPGHQGANDRMGEIIQLLDAQLGGVENQSYMFYKWLAFEWIYNTPLSEIISKRIAFLRKKGDKRSVSALIRELMKGLEKEIRFRLVKFYMAYVSLLALVLTERGDEDKAGKIDPFYVYLECGASDHVALSLMSLGLSRVTALALRKQLSFADDATPEDCYAQLKRTDWALIDVPSLCIREVKDLVGL